MGADLRRLVSLFALYARMDVLWIARGPGPALAWYVSDATVGLGLVTTTFLIAERFDGIGAWTRAEVLFLLAYSLAVRGLVDIAFGWNVAMISRRIGRGQLDHMLLQPQPLWVTVLTEGFSPVSGSGMLIAGGALLAFAVPGLDVRVDAVWLCMSLANVAGSTAIVLAFSYAWGSIAFWAPRAAEEINSSTMSLVDQLRGFPLDGVAPGLLTGLVTLVPVGFVAWLPSRALLGISSHPLAVLATPVCALTFAALSAWIFNRGLVHYGHTGSNRYHSAGHRR